MKCKKQGKEVKNIIKKSKAVKNIDFLSLMAKTKNKKKQQCLLDFANKHQIESIVECILNVLNGSVTLSNTDVKRLKRYKNTLRSITQKGVPISKKKTTLIQRGGFLPTLLPIAISALGNIIPAIGKLVRGERLF